MHFADMKKLFHELKGVIMEEVCCVLMMCHSWPVNIGLHLVGTNGCEADKFLKK